MNTFDIISEIRALEDLIFEVNEETGEVVDNTEILKDQIEAIMQEKSVKLENIERFKRELKGSNESLAKEIKRLQDKKKANENAINRLTGLQLFLLDGEKLKTDIFSFSPRTVKSLDYSDVSMFSLPDDLKRIKEEIDKTKVKEYIKAGGSIDGLKEVEKQSLIVR